MSVRVTVASVEWRSVIKCECACGYVSMYVWYVRVEICD